MEYKRFLADFPRLNHWLLDADGRYYLVMRPLRLWDAEENTYIKFRSMKDTATAVYVDSDNRAVRSYIYTNRREKQVDRFLEVRKKNFQKA